VHVLEIPTFVFFPIYGCKSSCDLPCAASLAGIQPVRLVNILTYFPILSYKYGVTIP